MTVALEMASRLPGRANKRVLLNKEPDGFLSAPWQS